MPVLTEKQTKFVEQYVASGSARGAALEAGYSPSVAHVATREILSSTAVQQAVSELRRELREEVKQRLAGAAVKAVCYLENCVADENAPHTARVRAAVKLLNRGGFAGPLVEDENNAANDLDDFIEEAARNRSSYQENG